ncbi:MAG TPA: signal recognition particle-docking protein FtsY, partial [Candidatus Nanoarchaeia archaeon]|nr:signal recognition particle-docking protein FtsY [Candidatus Nanoarchaeia archaeon]
KERVVKKFTEKVLSESDFSDFFSELELVLLQSNVAVDVIGDLKSKLSADLVGKSFKRGSIESLVSSSLVSAIGELLIEGNVGAIVKRLKESVVPVSFMFVGTNGSGKTTSIAKFANYLLGKGVSVVFAACDTFRAASIEQLEVHGNALGIKVVKHTYGADAAAVAYDALEHAKARGVKAVLIDTAGRSHSNVNLMRELEKVNRVVNPDFTVFVGDALTGNEVILQCRDFGQAAGFDFAILTKTDVDEKGGAIISVSHETGVPIMFIGTGQGYSDFKPFKKDDLLKQLGL